MSNRSDGSIIDKGNGKYLIRVFLGTDATGKRKYVSKQITGTISQAKQERTKMVREKHTGSLVEPSKLSLETYVEQWLSTKAGLSPKTKRDYEHLLKKHVVPTLGLRKLSQISPLMVAQLYASLSSERKLSPRTVRYTHTVLSQAFEQAVQWNMLVKNPCKGAELPENTESNSAGTTLTFEETATLLKWCGTSNTRFHALWRLLLTAGLRPQEVLTLKWSDLSDNGLSITRALKETKPGVWEPKERTKTGETRLVALSAETAHALSAHRSRQAAEILKAGREYTRNDFIFATRTGHHFTPPKIRAWWYEDLAKAGVRKVRLYDTRHTNISQELALGVPPNEVADRHGHDVVTMMNTYRHVIPGMKQSAPGLVEKALSLVSKEA